MECKYLIVMIKKVIFDTRMPRLCQKVDFEKKQGRAKGTKTFFFGGFI